MDSELQEFIDRFDNAKNPREKEQAASEYIDYKFSKKSGLDNIKDILIKLCIELDELDTNPFIIFVSNCVEQVSGALPNRKCITTLNNLFARGIIDEHNLDGTDEDENIKKSILYNENVYNSNVDSEFIITSYYWLSIAGNINKINYMALQRSADIHDRFLDSIYEMSMSATDRSLAIRNVIIYDISYEQARENVDTIKYPIRPKRDIETILHIAASRQKYDGQQTPHTKDRDNISSVMSIVAKMNDAEKDELFQALGVRTR